MSHGFLVHGDEDHVGIAVRDLTPGEVVSGRYLTSHQPITITVVDKIPLGHKVALVNLNPGDKLVEYHEVVGKVTQPIRSGQHVHIHNLKSVRWGA